VVGPANLERPQGGCIGRPPTDEEKKQQDARVAIQELGRRLQALHERARVLLQNRAPVDDVVASFLSLSAVDEALKATEADLDVLDGPLVGATAEETAANYVAHAKATESPEAEPTKKGKRKAKGQ